MYQYPVRIFRLPSVQCTYCEGNVCHTTKSRTRVIYSLKEWRIFGVNYSWIFSTYNTKILCLTGATLQRQNAENLKQIFPEKEYRGLSPNFHIHVSVSELYHDGSACSAGGNM
jgi:hypothetical protein